MPTKVKAPVGLDSSGAKLWRDVTGTYELRSDELRVLEDACREADLVDDLTREAKGQPRIVKGSQGQPVINPLISEVRQHRATLAALFRQLKLPDESDSTEARSAQARAAVNARWQKRGA